MSIKFLQLNILGAKYLDEIVSYVKEQDFDICHFQEVTGGSLNPSYPDSFKLLYQKLLREGALAVNIKLSTDPQAYSGNATFFKPNLSLGNSEIVWLKPFRVLETFSDKNPEEHPHNALDLTFTLNGKPVHFINTHLAWGITPEDKPYKVSEGEKLYEYIKGLTEPFVLSGDFNVPATSETVRLLDTLGRNHIVEHKITNTLNAETHRAKHLFPRGLAVDFLYTFPTLVTKNFRLIEKPNLSDHLGLGIEIEV